MDYRQFQSEAKGFHWRDGLYFERLKDGSVKATQYTPITTNWNDGMNKTWQIIIPAPEWASIVASMSIEGETTETYYVTLNRHNGTI